MRRPSEPQDEEVAQAQAVMQQLSNGYLATQIISVAAKLGIADLLSAGPKVRGVGRAERHARPPHHSGRCGHSPARASSASRPTAASR